MCCGAQHVVGFPWLESARVLTGSAALEDAVSYGRGAQHMLERNSATLVHTHMPALPPGHGVMIRSKLRVLGEDRLSRSGRR